uniref:DNA repair protein RAD50 n=1 Tax=Ciona savignyi TaxID=51511 RepID=H2ZIL2_CIOSA
MSMIDKMSIIGIRAFGPDDKHQQVIQFQHPLTLLVGPNGAGKTTIIECLKYATTGEHPQNTKGGAFVHDPKLANETEVKAKVRLRCRNVKGHMVEVERSMIATQKAKKVQFKTLDGILIKRRNDEEPVHLTSKCADLNQQMVEELGVSKAVLDNVIFCHQEDSNWPLSEGKSVKQKFDDIFAATRYIKALEEIRKIQKLQKGKLGQDKVEMKHLKTHCETAKEKKKLLEDKELKLQAAKESAENAEENIRPIESELRELKKKQTEIVVLDTELKTTKSRRQQMVEDERKLKSRIKNEFKASCYKLGQEQVLNAKRRQQNQLEKQINPLQDEINSFSKKKMNLSVEQAVKNAKAQQNQRNELIKDSSDRYGINLSYSGSELTDTEASSFVHSFQSHLEEELKQTWQMKTELQEGNKHKKKNLSALKEKSAELNQFLSYLTSLTNSLNQSFLQTTRDLHRLQTAADSGQLDELQIRLQKAEEKLQAAERSNKVDDLRRNLTEQNESKLELQRKIESLDSLIISMHKSAESRTKIEMLKKEKQSKEDAIINLKRKNQAMLEELGLASQSSFPDKMKMMRWIRGKESEVSSAQVCFDRKKSDFTQLSTKKEMVSSQIKAKKSRRSVLDETLLEVCGSDDLDQDLAKLDSEIKELQGNKGLTDGIQYMYKEFIKKLTVEGHEDKSEIPCPLCMRCFEETTEVDELIDDLQTKLDMAPEKLASQHKQLKQKQERYQVLLDNKPIKMELDRLQTSELPDLEKQYSNMSLKFGDAGRSKEEAEETWSKLKEEETKAKQCLPDVAQIDTLQDEMREINRKIRNLESELPMSSTSKSSEELNTEKRELGQNLSKLTQAMDQTRHEIEASTNLIHRLKDKVNSIQAEKLKLASDLHKCEQLQDQQQTLQDDIKKLKDEIELNERSLAPLLREVEDLEGKKNEVSRRNNTSLTDATQKLQTLQNQLRRLESIHQEVQRFSNSSVPDKLQRTIKQIDDLEMSMNSSENKLAKLRDDVERLKKELVTCVDRQRDLEDNSALRERRREIVEVDEEVERMKLELGGLDPVKLERKVRELNKEHSDLTKEIERNKVRQEGLEETVRGIKLELCRESLKFADERYKECMISATTLELASEDLDKYYKALDHAIMRYHKIKMEDINKIIRSLWQETYKGTGLYFSFLWFHLHPTYIDYIEICSSEDTGSSASTRRVFNYRVVMHCAGTAMDMRGRCSAGQKVLASLVIRLALAETFCISCGILALDEPTTNLDRANIDSLAEALLSIIETRSQQRNFQLVVITHDEEFVDLIGRSNYVDHFFRIKKDDRARSRIIRCPIRSLSA